jgi:hypothetical protein
MKTRLLSLFCLILATAAGLAQPKVLILDTTVYGGMNSVEARAAIALGYQVDIVDGTTWGTMTADDFSGYRAIILGDPIGGISAIGAAEQNRWTWGPKISGNVIIIGGDCANHPPAGWVLTTNAIHFAANQPDKTGLYLALSHYYSESPSGTPVPVLEPLGAFNVRGVGCYDQSHMIATHPVMNDLNDAVLSHWGCSVHEGFVNWPGSFIVLAIAEGESTAYTGPDLSVGTPYILAQGEGLVIVTNRFSLSPVTASNPTHSTHTVCATVVENGAFVSGVEVTFTVTSGPNAPTTGTAVTDVNGSACFTYSGNGGVGTDIIKAEYVDANYQTQTSNLAAKMWFDPCGTSALAAIIGTVYCESNKLIVIFNELVSELTATNLANYTLDHGFTVTNVSLQPGSQNLVIVQADQNFVKDTIYTLQISDVTDLCGRLLTPNPTVLIVQCAVLCPEIRCPSNIVADCQGPAGTKVHYEVYVNPACTNGLTLVCLPPPDSIFHGGTTTINCRAWNTNGLTNYCSFTVTVTDLLPPIIQCPSNIVVTATSCTNAIVNYTVTATDNCTANPAVVCTPPPGPFELGTTPVHCVATDDNGNTNSCDFTVTVLPDLANGVASTFDTDADNWMVVDRDPSSYPNNLLNELSVRTPAFISTGGNPDGFIHSVDGSGEWFWRAPAKFLGDQSSAYGGQLRFDLWSDLLDTRAPEDPYNILLVGSGLVLYIDLPDPFPASTWVPYCVQLRETAGWKVFPSGQPASSTDMMNVLANLQNLDIHAEFGIGPDSGSLDNVFLLKCPNEPACAVDIACPTNITIITCSNTAVVNYPSPVAASSRGSIVVVSNYPPPGIFPLGTTLVICTASDGGGHTDVCTFTVTVSHPNSMLLCPSNIVVDCTNDSGRVVNYPTQAVASIQYNPPSGSTFLIGTTPVSCTATDACGNVSTCTFDVVVRGHGNALGHWVKSDFGNTPLTQGNAIAVDRNGNAFVGGVFSGGSDGFVAKYDTLGTLLWIRQIAGPGNKSVRGVAVDSQGNCYVVGNFDGAYVYFPDPAYQLYLDNPTAGGSDIFLVKYSPNGGVLWFTTAGGPSGDNGEGVAVDDADNCYITGVFSGTANFGTTLLTSSSYDCFLAKWNADGVFQWATNSTGTSGHGVDARSVVIDSLHGKAFITGEFSSDAQFGSTTPLGPSGRFGSAFVAQLNLTNASPSWVWAKQVYCTNNCGSQDGRAIGVDTAGNCYFAAYFDGTASIGAPAATVTNLYPYSLNDYLIGKFRGDGFPLGLIKGLIQGDGEPRGLAVDRNSGDVYVTGFRHGFDSNADGGQDATLFKYDSNLSLKWTQSGSGSFPHQVNTGRGVALDSAGCVYVTGSYTDNSFVFYNFVDGVHKFSAPSGTTKLFVAKYCSSCSTNCVTATITAPLQNVLVTAGPSSANPISFTVTASGTPPLSFFWSRNNIPLPPPSGTGYTITISPDGLSSTLLLTGVPSIGTGSTYSVGVANFQCCDDCGPASSHASIFYWIIGGGGSNPVSRYQLGIAAGSGVVYRVEYRDDLNPGTPWQFLTNMIGTGTNAVIFDPNPNPVMRFYQIPLQPDE